MSSNTVVMVLVLLLTMNGATEQKPPLGCFCFFANSPHDDCSTRGCSTGTNLDCKNYSDVSRSVITGYYIGYYGPVPVEFFDYGCNCPISSYTGNNGYYSGDPVHADPGGPFNYTTCTAFGTVGGGHDFIFASNATDCCNFCCDRNDPYPPTTSVSGS